MHHILSVALFVGRAHLLPIPPTFAMLPKNHSKASPSLVLSRLERLILVLLVVPAGSLLSPSSSFPTKL